MKRFLSIVALALIAFYAEAVKIAQIQNQSRGTATISDSGPVKGVVFVGKYGQPLTQAELDDLNVSRRELTFPEITSIAAGNVGGPVLLYGSGQIQTNSGTFSLGNADINALVIRPDGSVTANGTVLS